MARFCAFCGADVGGAADRTGGRRSARRAPPADRPLLRPRRLDARSRSSSTPRTGATSSRSTSRRAAGAVARFGGHVAQVPRRWAARLLRLADGARGRPRARGARRPRDRRRDGAAERAAASATARARGARRHAHRAGRRESPTAARESFGETANVAARVQSAAEPDTVVITRRDAAPGGRASSSSRTAARRRSRACASRSRSTASCSRAGCAAASTSRRGGSRASSGARSSWRRSSSAGSGRADGEGQNVLVVGEAGVGKSRLAYQLRERLAAVPHTWLECGATPYTEGTPFHPVIALVAQGLAFAPDDTPAEKLAKIERGLARRSPRRRPWRCSRTSSACRRRRRSQLSPDAAAPEDDRAAGAVEPRASARCSRSCCWSRTCTGATPRRWSCSGASSRRAPTARVLLRSRRRGRSSRRPGRRASNLTTLQLARLTKRQARDMIATLAGDGAARRDARRARRARRRRAALRRGADEGGGRSPGRRAAWRRSRRRSPTR